MVESNKEIIVGDIGGTNVRFARIPVTASPDQPMEIWKQKGDDFNTFDEALDAFLQHSPGPVAGASFGVAGVLKGNIATLLHRPWNINARELRIRLKTSMVVLVNDFMAMARSAPDLPQDMLGTIRDGKSDPNGSVVVGGPGTGFGLATLRRIYGTLDLDRTDYDSTAPSEKGWLVIGGEGGHQAFNPVTELEWKLAQLLRRADIYVSNEIIAAGVGFDITFRALAKIMGVAYHEYTPEEVTEKAQMGDHLCTEMCRLRARCTLAALGDAALSANATGGVYIAGGVSGWLESWLREPNAIARFNDRGPRTKLLENIPIELIAGDEAPLIGAHKLWLDYQSRGWI